MTVPHKPNPRQPNRHQTFQSSLNRTAPCVFPCFVLQADDVDAGFTDCNGFFILVEVLVQCGGLKKKKKQKKDFWAISHAARSGFVTGTLGHFLCMLSSPSAINVSPRMHLQVPKRSQGTKSTEDGLPYKSHFIRSMGGYQTPYFKMNLRDHKHNPPKPCGLCS